MRLSFLGWTLRCFVGFASIFYAMFPAIGGELEPIRVGAILHLSGDLAMQGNAFREGIEVALEEINSAGGIGGRLLEVVFEDSHFNLSNVHRSATKLLEKDRVVGVLISNYHEAKTAAPLFERARVPLLCLWDSTPELDEMGGHLGGSFGGGLSIRQHRSGAQRCSSICEPL